MSTRVMTRVPVVVYADDPVTRSGVEAQLRGRPGVELREADTWRIDGSGPDGGLDGRPNGHHDGGDPLTRSGSGSGNGRGSHHINGINSTNGTNGHGGTGQGHGSNGYGIGYRTLGRTATAVEDPPAPATVAVVVVDEIDERAVRTIRALTRSDASRVLVVAGRLDETSVLSITEAGACGLLRRSEATPERLVPAVTAAAAGEGTIPPDLLGRLLEQVGHLQRQVLSPRGLTFSGLTERELQVLRLVADGSDTAEIAGILAYSERTVKNIIHDVTSRLQLRNRSHAVAWAMRQGLL